MRKFFAGFLSLMMVACLAGCGTDEAPSVESGKEIEIIESIETEEETENTSVDDMDFLDETEEDEVSLGEVSKDINIEETVLYDENDVKITINGLTYTNYDVEVEITFENNSDKPLSFIAGSLGCSMNAINGFMIRDGYVNCDVEPGAVETDFARFSYGELLIHGITEIAEIQMGFSMSDEDYNYTYTGPLSVKTALADSYDFENTAYRTVITSPITEKVLDMEMVFFGEEELYSTNGVSVISEGYAINRDDERVLMLEVQNKSEEIITFETFGLQVNGTLVYEYTCSTDTVTPGNRIIVSVYLDNVLDEDEWEETGITEIETIGLSIDIRDQTYCAVAETGEIIIDMK